MSQPRTLTKDNQLEKYLASERPYGFFPFPGGCEAQPLSTLQGFNIKIVTNGTRVYSSGITRKDRILVTVVDQDDILGEISTELTISAVSQYHYIDNFGRTIRKMAPVASDDDVIEIKAFPSDIAKEKKIATNGPYPRLDKTIADLNKVLAFFYSSKEPIYLEQSKHFIKLAAHLVQESYYPRAAEWDVLKKLAPTLSLNNNLLAYIDRLEIEIKDITESGKELILVAIYLLCQDLAHSMQIKTQGSLLKSISIVQDLIKLEAWLNKVNHEKKKWGDYARESFPLKEIYSSSSTTPPTPPSTGLPTSTVSSRPTAASSTAPSVTPPLASVQSPTLLPPAVQDQPVAPHTGVVRDPYGLLMKALRDFTKVLTDFTESTSINLAALHQRSDDLMKQGALLVEESYRAKTLELNTIIKLAQTILNDQVVSLVPRMVRLNQEINEIHKASEIFVSKAITLFNQDINLICRKTSEAPFFITISILMNINKLTDWLRETSTQEEAPVASPTPTTTVTPLPLHPVTDSAAATLSYTSIYASPHSPTIFTPRPPSGPPGHHSTAHRTTGKRKKH